MAGSRDEGGTVNLIDYFHILWRRKFSITGVVLFITIFSAIVVFQLTPIYTATTLVIIDDRKMNVVQLESVLSSAYNDIMKIESEVQVIKSRDLAKKIVKKTELLNVLEFNPELDDKKSAFSLIPKEWIRAIVGDKTETLSDEEKAANEYKKVVDNFLDNLSVKPKKKSRVIQISFTSEDPKLAAEVVNTVGDLYILEQLEAKFEATKRATIWLNERVSDLRKKVKGSESAVEAYKKKHGLIEAEGLTVNTQQVSELTTQLILARSQLAASTAKMRQLDKIISRKGSEGLESASDVLASRLIQELRVSEASLVSKISQLSQEYGDRHPVMISAKAEANEVRRKIKAEINRIVAGIKNEVEIARARVKSLDADLGALRKKVEKNNAAEVRLRALKREAKANRALFDTFLSRFKETSEQEDLNQADARIISRADVPTEPTFPKKIVLVGAAFVFSIFMGIALAFILELLDSGFRSADQIEGMTGIASLGLVPLLSGINANGKAPERIILNKPNSVYGESIRSIKISLLAENIDKTPKLILITSAVPNEGKSTFVASLGRQAAMSGQKVMIIDCDIRHPTLHKKLGEFSNKKGLVDHLMDDEPIKNIICKDKSGAHLMPAGRYLAHPESLFTSSKMKKLLGVFAEVYDLILIDSPPVLAVSDSLVLSSLVDKVIYIVQWEATKRELAFSGVKSLLAVNADLAGIVLSKVDVRKHAKYGYSDSGKYYYAKYNKYYTDNSA